MPQRNIRWQVCEALYRETGRKIPKSYLEKLLKTLFIAACLSGREKTYQGTHKPLITSDLFTSVQEVFQGHNRSRYRKHEFAFAGLLQCAYDNCTVTAERKKGKYVYYRYGGYRGKCALPRFREADMGLRLAQLLKDIYIPDLFSNRCKELSGKIRTARNLGDGKNGTGCKGDWLGFVLIWTEPTWTNWTAKSRRISGRGKPMSGNRKSSRSYWL
ncbi:MAG: hypothetical protein HY313_00665 [Acidobacteria bacterium]|nr:hypothetical protein [Acidobacteriota bacterium]